MLEVQPATAADVQILGQSLVADAVEVQRFGKLTGPGNAQAFARAQTNYFNDAQKLSIIAATHPDLADFVVSFFAKAQAVLSQS